MISVDDLDYISVDDLYDISVDDLLIYDIPVGICR